MDEPVECPNTENYGLSCPCGIWADDGVLICHRIVERDSRQICSLLDCEYCKATDCKQRTF